MTQIIVRTTRVGCRRTSSSVSPSQTNARHYDEEKSEVKKVFLRVIAVKHII